MLLQQLTKPAQLERPHCSRATGEDTFPMPSLVIRSRRPRGWVSPLSERVAALRMDCDGDLPNRWIDTITVGDLIPGISPVLRTYYAADSS
ncbi:hypothetical protein ACWCQ1_07180 [Streptomyces sp. NPDC002144]|uniref:hypothetical protein n=1 Tax=Streptomyces sp. NPDC006668 TaxID=3156903 RepID=UPI0033F1E9A2